MSSECTYSDLRKLQLIELDLLREVDRICRTHGIRYYLASGTMLGAVRHGGFIPWDDDVDIEMPYADYIRFCEICKSELDSDKYFLQNMDNDPRHLYIFAKFRRNNTLYVRKGQEHMKFHHGICIDIFPSYPIPSTKIVFYLFAFLVARCKTIMWSRIGAKSEKNTLLRLLYKMIAIIPKGIPKKIILLLVSMCKGDIAHSIGTPFFGDFKLLRNRMNHVSDRGNLMEVLDKLQPTEMIEIEFEGLSCPAQSNYDYMLTFLYGDYMQLPPEEECVGHHLASILDFGNAFDELKLNIQEEIHG